MSVCIRVCVRVCVRARICVCVCSFVCLSRFIAVTCFYCRVFIDAPRFYIVVFIQIGV